VQWLNLLSAFPGLYCAPAEGDCASYIAYLETLPIIPHPEAFGLHENADITKDQNDTAAMFDSLLSLGGGGEGGGGGGSGEDRVASVVAECMERLPHQFDIEEVQRK
jgi:dynein heavy chain